MATLKKDKLSDGKKKTVDAAAPQKKTSNTAAAPAVRKGSTGGADALRREISSLSSEGRRQAVQTVQKKLAPEVQSYARDYTRLAQGYASRESEDRRSAPAVSKRSAPDLESLSASLRSRHEKYSDLLDALGGDMDEDFRTNLQEILRHSSAGLAAMGRGRENAVYRPGEDKSKIEQLPLTRGDRGQIEQLPYRIGDKDSSEDLRELSGGEEPDYFRLAVNEYINKNRGGEKDKEQIGSELRPADIQPEQEEQGSTWKDKALDYLDAIDTGMTKGIWEGGVTNLLNAGASRLGFRANSKETDTPFGIAGVRDQIQGAKDLYDRLGSIWGDYTPGDGNLLQNIGESGSAIYSQAKENFGTPALVRQVELDRDFQDKLGQIWDSYEAGDGSLGQNMKDTFFAGFHHANRSIEEGLGKSNFTLMFGNVTGPVKDALGKNEDRLVWAMKQFALPALTGSTDKEENAKWLTGKAYEIGDKLTEAVSPYIKNAAGEEYLGQEDYQNAMSDKDAGVQLAGNVAAVVGNMIPSIGISVMTGSPEAAKMAMSASAAGAAAKEAYDAGATPEQAYYIGVEKGTIEYLTECMFDVAGFFGGGTVPKGVGKLLNAFADTTAGRIVSAIAGSKAGKAVGKVIEGLGENVEEAASDWASPGVEKAVLGHTINGEDDISFLKAMEGQLPWSEQGFITTLSTVVLSLFGVGANAVGRNVTLVSPEEAQEIVDYARETGDGKLISLAEQYQKKIDKQKSKGKKGSISVAQFEKIGKKALDAEIRKAMVDPEGYQRELENRGEISPVETESADETAVHVEETETVTPAEDRIAEQQAEAAQTEAAQTEAPQSETIQSETVQSEEQPAKKGRSAEARAATEKAGYDQARSLVESQTPERQSYLRDKRSVYSEFLDGLEKGDRIFLNGEQTPAAEVLTKSADGMTVAHLDADGEVSSVEKILPDSFTGNAMISLLETAESLKVGAAESSGPRATAAVSVQESGQTREGSAASAPVNGAQIALASAARGRADADMMQRAYHEGQDVKAYSEAWSFAADALGAHFGMTVEEAREKYPSKFREMTDAQLDLALTVGRKAAEARVQQAKAKAAEQRENRKKAAGAKQKADTSKGKKGSVSMKGGKFNGRTYRGVDVDSLSKKEKRVVAMAQRLADAMGYHFVFFEGHPADGGTYIGDGTIFVNIKAGNLSNKTLAAAVIGHEVVHSFQEKAPTAYEALQKHVLTHILQKSPAEFEALVQAQMRLEPGIGYGKAVDEIVANACQTMLRDSAEIHRLVRENMTLGERVRDTIEGIADKFKSAYADVDIHDDEEVYRAARAIADAYDEILEDFDNAVREYKQNVDAEKVTGKKISAGEGGVKNMYLGERAREADTTALDTAREMEKKGESAETIRQKTGWFRGMDGKWRFEIDDSGAKYYRGGDAQFRKDHPEYARYVELTEKMLGGSITNEEFAELRELAATWGAEQRRLQEMVNRGKATLGMILDHEALFDAYPELKNARIRFADLDPGTKGQYNRKYNNFSISNELRNAPEYTLIHEIQHAIQAEEGFSGGASPAYWEERLKNGHSLKKTAAIEDADRKYQELYDSAPDEMKRLLQARSDAMKEMDTDRWDQLEDELYDKYGEFFMQIDDADRKRSTVRFDERKRQSKEFYLDTAGEIEAIDASYRSRMTAEERKNTPPDLGDENTVFAEDGDESFSTDMSGKKDKIPHGLVLDAIRSRFTEVKSDQAVKSITGNEFQKTESDTRPLKAKIKEFFDSLGNKVTREGFGDIALNSAGVHDSLEHGYGKLKAATFAALPDVLQKGQIFNADPNHELHPYDSYLIVAPVIVGTERCYVGAIVMRDANTQRYKIHEVLTERENGTSSDKSEAHQLGSGLRYDVPSVNSISDSSEKSKGQNEEAVTDYGENPDASNMMFGTKETEQERKAREESVSNLKAENDILRARAAYWKGQTQQTRERTVRQQDTDRLANDLLRRYESRADKAEVKEALKEMGDWLVQSDGDSLSYDELYDRARNIAEEIVDGNYALIDDSQKENLERLKDYLKSTPVKLTAEDWSDTGDENFRRRYGRYFTVSESGRTIDSLWGEMAAMFGEGVFPEDTYAPGDMLNMLGDYLDMWKPQYGNVFEANWNEAVDAAAGEIIDRMLGEEVRQTSATFADRAQQRLNAQIAKDKAKLDALREQKNARIEEIKRQASEKSAQIRMSEKAAKYEAVSKVKEHYQDMMQRQSEKRTETAGQRKYRAQVAEKVERLEKMLLTNSDKMHVPEVLKAPLADFLASIDFSSKSHLKNGTTTRADVKFQAALTALNDVLTKQERYLNGEENAEDRLGGYLDISQEAMDFLRETTEEIHRMMQTGEAYTVNAMSAEHLQGLSKLLSNITSAIRNMNNFMANERFATVKEAADADIRHMESLGSASEAARGSVVSALAWENGTPFYVLRRFGEGGKAVFDAFARGWEKMAFNVKEIIDFTEKVYTDKEVKTWKSEIHDITLSDGSQIRMTTAQIMALSQLIGREQAVKHITKGGIRIGNIKGKVGEIVDTNHYHLTPEDMSLIIGQLTPRQMSVAKALQRFMAVKGAQWGNEVSMRRFGYNFYDEGESYYPIRTDSNDRGMQDTEAMQNSMFRLLNLSASKSLNPKASNALLVEDIFDTFADHMADMAKLNGMGLPVLDAIKWFNYKDRVDLGNGEYDTRTIQGAMEQAFGDRAQRYFRTLMKDINGVTEAGDRGTGLLATFMSNYKAAAVGANLRVAFLQPTSYVRAAAIISPKYLAFAFTNRNAYKEALANSGTAVWKSLGYYDTNISRGMREQIEHNDSWKDKIVEGSMSLAELGDKLTWGRLWVACKMQAKATNQSLEGRALIDATSDLFREVIYATQVMDSTLTRSELMRGKTLYSKAMTAFMAEPTLSYNLLMDAVSSYHLDVRANGKQGAWRRNSAKIGTAFSTYVASAAFAAVVESVADAFRDDDNDEFWEKFLEALLGEGVTARIRGEKSTESILASLLSGNLAQDLTIIGKLPYVKSMYSTLQGYKSKDMSSAAFDAIIDSVKIWQETVRLANGKLDSPTKVTYYGNMTDWGKIYKSLQAISQLSGIGGSNLTRDVLAVWNSTVGEFRPDWKIKTYQSKAERTYLDKVYPHGVSWSVYQSALTAMDTDENGSVKQDEAGPYLRDEMEAGRLTEEQAEAIWSAATSGKKTFAEWLEKNS